jgi:hypothetical protein
MVTTITSSNLERNIMVYNVEFDLQICLRIGLLAYGCRNMDSWIGGRRWNKAFLENSTFRDYVVMWGKPQIVHKI